MICQNCAAEIQRVSEHWTMGKWGCTSADWPTLLAAANQRADELEEEWNDRGQEINEILSEIYGENHKKGDAVEGIRALQSSLAAERSKREATEAACAALTDVLLSQTFWHNFDGPHGSDLCICVTERADYSPVVTRPETHEDYCVKFRAALAPDPGRAILDSHRAEVERLQAEAAAMREALTKTLHWMLHNVDHCTGLSEQLDVVNAALAPTAGRQLLDELRIARAMPWTECEDCGRDVAVDEDGCCATCGADALNYGVNVALDQRDTARASVSRLEAELAAVRGDLAKHTALTNDTIVVSKDEIAFRDQLISAVRIRCRSEIERWEVLTYLFDGYDRMFAAPQSPPETQRPADPDERCNRRDCRSPRATWWNTSTRAYYCQPCAFKINDHAPGLCVPPPDQQPSPGEGRKGAP